MNQETAAVQKMDFRKELANQASGIFSVIFGSIFLAVMGQLAIPLPFTPVPVTLQTLGVALLAISLGSRRAPLAVLAYLVQATAGMPVLAGGISNPLWMVGMHVGYLIGFVIAAFLVAKLLERCQPRSFLKTWLILSVNEITILGAGALGLVIFVGWENVMSLGILPFLPGAALKITMAAAATRPCEWLKTQISSFC